MNKSVKRHDEPGDLHGRVWSLLQAGVNGHDELVKVMSLSKQQVGAWLMGPAEVAVDAEALRKLTDCVQQWEQITPAQTLIRKSELVMRLRELAKEAIDVRADALAMEVHRSPIPVRVRVRQVLDASGKADRVKSEAVKPKDRDAVPGRRSRRS